MTSGEGNGGRRMLRERLSGKAVAAAVAEAREHGLRVEEPFVLADLFSLMVHLRPAPVVARVATRMGRLRAPIEDWLEREIAVTEYLSAGGAPVVPPSRELPPGPHQRDGFWLSFWTYVEPDPDRAPSAEDCSAMLPELHEAMANYPGELPMLAADDIPNGLARLDRARDLLGEADARLLRDSAERLRPLWEPGSAEVRPLHGDAHPGNLIAARGDGLVWIDFEDACLGPPEWDLATISDPAAVAAHHDPDPRMMERCEQLRALQVALALIAFHEDFGDMAGWDEGIRGMLGKLAAAS